MLALVVAVLATRPAVAEDVCVGAGTIGPLPVALPEICVPVP